MSRKNTLTLLLNIEEATIISELTRYIDSSQFEGVVSRITPIVKVAEGRVDLEGLGIFAPVGANGRISGVTDSDISPQALEMVFAEFDPDEAVPFFCVEIAAISDDTGRILAPVLYGQQALIDVSHDIVVAVNSNNTAHF